MTVLAAFTIAAGATAAPDQGRHSRDVIRFFDNHAWLRAPNQPNCTSVPWRKSCRIARRVYKQHSANLARLEQAAMAYQYDWQTWMPRGSKWYRVASCETGYGRDPNWSHDSGTYVSAFGIFRPGYADDAHRVGNMSWDETVRARGTVPTPREQYEAALSHYRAHGGFSGWGCRGA